MSDVMPDIISDAIPGTTPNAISDERPKRVSFHTLGCKLNFSESSTLARQFAEGGFERCSRAADADVCVVNTCSVTGQADKKCRNLIRRIASENPGAIIAVTGCYAQLRPDDIAAIDGVDIVVGNDAKGELYSKVAAMIAARNSSAKGSDSKKTDSKKTDAENTEDATRGAKNTGEKNHAAATHGCDSLPPTSFFAAFSSGDRTRAFLKVQDGCSYKCSYCTIPYARGESRSAPIAYIVAQARKIAEGGQKEIVITGINTGDFGRTTGESFADLLRALDNIEGIERYRISSIEPNLLTDEIIALTAASRKFMPHFHIPLQSGCDSILASMRRRYTTELFAERIAAVRHAMPGAFIGIDVIVGFPGETDKDFETTHHFLETIAPAFLHVFPYSERPGTPAVELPGKVPANVAARRVKKLTSLSDRLHDRFAAQAVGTKARVLFESNVRDGEMSGFTENYIRVHVPCNSSLINDIAEVKITASRGKGETEGVLL